MTSKTILLTGGAGFIGQNLVHHLLRESPECKLIIIDSLTYAANPASLQAPIESGQITFVRGDISELSNVRAIFELHPIEEVAHLAAESHVDRSIRGPDAFVETNILGTYNLLKCALDHWRSRSCLDRARFLHVSTDEVFGDLGPEEPPFTESSPYKPSSPYSATKAASDHLARAFCKTYGLPVIVTNCSNNYGPYQHPEKLIPLMILHALEGTGLPIYGDGSNIRDWLYVEDHCRAIALALDKGTAGETYNIGGGMEKSNREVVGEVCDLIDMRFRQDPSLAQKYPNCPSSTGDTCQSLITFVGDRPGHDRRYAINMDFACRKLQFRPRETFATGLLQTVDWYLENEAWCRQAMSPEHSVWLANNYGSRTSSAPIPHVQGA